MMTSSFSAVDYVIFGTIFVISSTVGAVFGYNDRNKQSTENYYFGGRKIAPIPVAISISVSYISAITMIGMPVEIYLFGNVFAWYAVAATSANIFAIVYYVPVFHRLRLNSLYEYLELRFSKTLRLLTSAIGVLHMVLHGAVAIYVPSLALSTVTPLSLNWSIALMSSTCTFYTTLGGMKAVIWTDVLQSIIMIFGMTAVLIKGCISVGGFDSVFSAVERGGRNNFLTFDIDPRIRSTFWTLFVGCGVMSCFEFICSQIIIQRWLSCKTIKASRTAVVFSMIFLGIVVAISLGNGLMMYAYYEECDPLKSGKITKKDQMLPRLVAELFQNIRGMTGLFVSAAFCAALSTVSSLINSLSALTLIDFVLPKFPNLPLLRQVVLSKIFTILFGSIEMSLAYALSLSSANVTEISGALTGLSGGPILSVFTMGILMPWINSKAAMSGLIVGFGCTTWVGLSAYLYSTISETKLPISTRNCAGWNTSLHAGNLNVTEVLTTDAQTYTYSSTAEQSDDKSLTIYNTFYAISPYYYGLFGFLISILIAHFTSLFFGFSKTSEADNRLFVPLIDNTLLPAEVRKIFRFGVAEKENNKIRSTNEQLENLT